MPPNTPDQVSILIGVPLTRSDYNRRTHTSDWLSQYRDEADARESYWKEVYLPKIAEPLLELREKALSLGVHVATGTLAELARVTELSRVVVMMAHWKDSTVLSEDLMGPKERGPWLARCSHHSSPLAQWLAAHLQPERESPTRSWTKLTPWALSARKKQELSVRDLLKQSLTIELAEENPSTGTVQIREAMTTRVARRREELDSIFTGLIRPGNRLELLDGLHSKETLEQWIAPTFDGVLDLASCTSTVLADYVSRRRKRRVRLIIAPNPIEFVATAPIVGSTLDLLAAGNFSYQEARANAGKFWEGAACAT